MRQQKKHVYGFIERINCPSAHTHTMKSERRVNAKAFNFIQSETQLNKNNVDMLLESLRREFSE